MSCHLLIFASGQILIYTTIKAFEVVVQVGNVVNVDFVGFSWCQGLREMSYVKLAIFVVGVFDDRHIFTTAHVSEADSVVVQLHVSHVKGDIFRH